MDESSTISDANSPGPAPDMSPPTHSTKRMSRTPKERQPPKIRRRYKATRNLFPHDATAISFLSSGSNTPTLLKLPKTITRLTYFRQNFDDVRPIGEGSFGEVFSARCKTTEHYYAVKKSKDRFRSDFDRNKKLEEVRKHELIPKHDNCVQFFKAWEEDDYLYIQLELCRTSLEEYTLINHELSHTMLWDILLDIALAVKHLHDHDLLHLDIKLENILMSLDGKFKLGDFGLVIDLSKDDIEDAVEGDPKYLAPELMSGNFTKAADIFSLGMIMLELATDLDLPSRGPLWHELRNGVFPDEHTKHICPDLFNLIKATMAPNCSERPNIDNILDHPQLQRLMYRRRRLHYVNHVVSQVQSLYNMGCAALKTFMGYMMLPLGYLNNGSRQNSKNYIRNGFISPNTLPNGDWDLSFLGEIHSARSSPRLFSASPRVSPIQGNAQTYYKMSVPNIVIASSTPNTPPPFSPRKRSSASLQESIIPMNSHVKRQCVLLAEPDQCNKGDREVQHDLSNTSCKRTSNGARNLLPMFSSCENN